MLVGKGGQAQDRPRLLEAVNGDRPPAFPSRLSVKKPYLQSTLSSGPSLCLQHLIDEHVQGRGLYREADRLQQTRPLGSPGYLPPWCGGQWDLRVPPARCTLYLPAG